MCLQVPLQCKKISADSLVISITCMFASFEFIYFFRFSPFPHCANFAVKFPTFSSGFKPEWLISMFFAVSAIVSFDFLTVLHTLESKPEKNQSRKLVDDCSTRSTGDPRCGAFRALVALRIYLKQRARACMRMHMCSVACLHACMCLCMCELVCVCV